ncbi:MAG: thioredoxin domain-containing protein [Kiritimatiellales bacterium]|nr:thioredoxin domain-containing protein [Kiritimatiellales bacterium]MCF7864622.1 thioredoxin domain-containing protein [Kiritimatiellales bacterium]
MKFTLVILLSFLARIGWADPAEKDTHMHKFTNRLAEEKSPYLLQHAHNPVDWYPWGEGAFAKAKEEDKPIFLSIGYATCHWCHVMEHESFENEEIAKLMNEAFVCIKVDREERPDIDNIYMTVCQMMTGSGGWPLTIIMTPDKKPFHAATYIPPEGRYGRIGMKQLIPRIFDAWKNDRAKVLNAANEITDVLGKQTAKGSGAELSHDLLPAGYDELMQEYDPRYGGFGQQPKFPTPHRLVFLLRQGNEAGVAAVEHTLEQMRMGGIFDQVGFGFHRYSTDAQWLVPHFEKMLYDQALLAIAYTEAYELTGKAFYADVAKEILTYVQRDMTAPVGGFYSAEDADSEGEEGVFYVWSAKEINAVLGGDAEWVSKVWNITEAGNFRDEATGRMTGNNILHLSTVLPPTDAARLSALRKKLFDVREKRIHPLKDTKILTDWNGLMIAAFAKAGRAFGNVEYVQTAINATAFVEREMRQESGELWHRYRDGHKAVQAHLDDYAFMIFGLLELYESTFDVQHLETALRYNDILTKSFVDVANGGYFMTATGAEELIVRPKEIYDGALPSGNSVQMLNLLKLARLTGRSGLEQQAVETGKAFSGSIDRSPSNFSQALIALQFATDDSLEVVVVGKRDSTETRQMLDYINSVYKPGKVVLFKDPAMADRLASIAPFTKEQEMVAGKTTVYICRNFACSQPIHSREALKESLK